MIEMESLLVDIQRAVAQAGDDVADMQGFLADPAFLMDRLMRGEQRREAHLAAGASAIPRFCIFSVTWQCNLDCVGCYANNYTPGGEMSLDKIRQTMQECIDAGTYFFVVVGGEPLMVPGLIETLGELDDGLFLLFTNGTLLTDEHAQSLAACRNVLPIFSMEGNSCFTDWRRGGGVGSQVDAAMGRLTARSVPFGVSCMVTRKNVSLVTSRAWFDEIWTAGARFAFLIDYIPMGEAPDESLILTPDDMSAKESALEGRWEEARPLVVNFPPDEYSEGSPCLAAGGGMIHINADGYVEPCPFSHYAADNVRDASYLDILERPFLSRIRSEVCCRPNPTKSCLLHQNQASVKAIAAEADGFCTENLNKSD